MIATVCTVVAPHDPSPARLAEVTREMRDLGPPKIRAWWDGEKWRALEGSHRLAAAQALRLVPEIDPVDLDDEIEHDFEGCSGRRVQDLIEHFVALGPHYSFAGLARGS